MKRIVQINQSRPHDWSYSAQCIYQYNDDDDINIHLFLIYLYIPYLYINNMSHGHRGVKVFLRGKCHWLRVYT